MAGVPRRGRGSRLTLDHKAYINLLRTRSLSNGVGSSVVTVNYADDLCWDRPEVLVRRLTPVRPVVGSNKEVYLGITQKKYRGKEPKEGSRRKRMVGDGTMRWHPERKAKQVYGDDGNVIGSCCRLSYIDKPISGKKVGQGWCMMEYEAVGFADVLCVLYPTDSAPAGDIVSPPRAEAPPPNLQALEMSVIGGAMLPAPPHLQQQHEWGRVHAEFDVPDHQRKAPRVALGHVQDGGELFESSLWEQLGSLENTKASTSTTMTLEELLQAAPEQEPVGHEWWQPQSGTGEGIPAPSLPPHDFFDNLHF